MASILEGRDKRAKFAGDGGKTGSAAVRGRRQRRRHRPGPAHWDLTTARGNEELHVEVNEGSR
jgi:hypothetical protein